VHYASSLRIHSDAEQRFEAQSTFVLGRSLVICTRCTFLIHFDFRFGVYQQPTAGRISGLIYLLTFEFARNGVPDELDFVTANSSTLLAG
jgi:hypothetical protein